MIKTVIFDLGRVLVPLNFEPGYRQIEVLSGIPASEIPARIAATGLVEQLETGQISDDGFYIRLADALEMSLTIEEFREIWCSVFQGAPLISEDLVERISKTHRLLLLSNTSSLHFEMLRETLPLLRHFHGYVLSCEVGVMKPGPEIYQAAIAAANCAPGECFFTDDLAENVEAAKRAGIDAVQFLSAGQIEAELRARAVI